eukprot:364934-Chlamydomonas_euryale.AAC.8
MNVLGLRGAAASVAAPAARVEAMARACLLAAALRRRAARKARRARLGQAGGRGRERAGEGGESGRGLYPSYKRQPNKRGPTHHQERCFFTRERQTSFPPPLRTHKAAMWAPKEGGTSWGVSAALHPMCRNPPYAIANVNVPVNSGSRLHQLGHATFRYTFWHKIRRGAANRGLWHELPVGGGDDVEISGRVWDVRSSVDMPV